MTIQWKTLEARDKLLAAVVAAMGAKNVSRTLTSSHFPCLVHTLSASIKRRGREHNRHYLWHPPSVYSFQWRSTPGLWRDMTCTIQDLIIEPRAFPQPDKRDCQTYLHLSFTPFPVHRLLRFHSTSNLPSIFQLTPLTLTHLPRPLVNHIPPDPIQNDRRVLRRRRNLLIRGISISPGTRPSRRAPQSKTAPRRYRLGRATRNSSP